MHNHAPPGHDCSFCRLANGLATDLSDQDDIVYRDESVCAFISLDWKPNNPGHVLVVPAGHYENIYDLPVSLATDLHSAVREVALAFKQLYKCHGVSTRQHNEPAGNQDVWHYHVHVFPRYEKDDMYRSGWRRTTPGERYPYATLLRGFFSDRSFTGS